MLTQDATEHFETFAHLKHTQKNKFKTQKQNVAGKAYGEDTSGK